MSPEALLSWVLTLQCRDSLAPIRQSAGAVSLSLESDMPMELTYLLAAETHGDAEHADSESELVHKLDVGDGDCHDPGGDLGAPIDCENVPGSQRSPESVRGGR